MPKPIEVDKFLVALCSLNGTIKFFKKYHLDLKFKSTIFIIIWTFHLINGRLEDCRLNLYLMFD
jgi:hypothetical protein